MSKNNKNNNSITPAVDTTNDKPTIESEKKALTKTTLTLQEKTSNTIKYFNDTCNKTDNVNDIILASILFKKMRDDKPEIKLLIYVFYNILKDNGITLKRESDKAPYHIIGYKLAKP
jgi:hypothetical protein